MICPKCQTDNRENAKFCDECGFDLRLGECALEPEAEIEAVSGFEPEREPEPSPVPEPEPKSDPAPEPEPEFEPKPELSSLPNPAAEPIVSLDSAREGVAAEARAMFGMNIPSVITAPGEPTSPEVTADFAGFERLVDSSYVPPSYSGRAGDTMEFPCIDGDRVSQTRSFIAEPDRKELRRQKRAQRKLEHEREKREKEQRKQAAAATASSSAANTSSAASSAALSSALKVEQIAAEAKEISESQHPNMKRNRIIGALAAIACFAALVAGITYSLQLWGGKTVPDVMSLSEQDARYVLEQKGFAVDVVETKSDDIEGIALSTDPHAGSRAKEGATIALNVSTARVIPDIVGKQRSEAEPLIDAEKLASVEYKLVKSNEEEGSILSVSPEVGTKVKQNTAVVIEVAEPFVVPDVEGMPTEQAIEALKAEGYEVETAWHRTEDIPEGTAVSTEPEAGARLSSGSKVVLYLAHNRSTELESLTRAFFTDSPRLVIAGSNYEMSEVGSVQYIGSNTCTFSIVARPYETHTWMFGLGSETRYGSYETITGSISWDDDNNIVATTPVMKQGA